MKPTETRLTLEQTQAAYELSRAGAGRLLANGKWVNPLLAAIVCDRYGLVEVSQGLCKLADHQPEKLVRVIVISDKLSFVPSKNKGTNRRYNADEFNDFWQNKVIGAVVCTFELLWFIKSEHILEWNEVGILRDGVIQREKALRLLEALPEDEDAD